MKDLSVEQKAKRYDEALGKARQLCDYPTSKPFISDLQDLFPELKESEDEQIRKEDEDIRKWLISQLEIKSDMNNSCELELMILKSIAWLEKQGKQNVDKVEPKFKVGDWIVFNGLTLLVNEVVQGYYRTISKGGIPNSYDWGIDYAARLWTIKDATDGDVLCLGGVIAIFKKYIGQENCICYCSFCDNGGFEIPIENGEDNVYGCTDTTPANKEQRDLLFAKMHEAGYEWDKDKKELIKQMTDDEHKQYMLEHQNETIYDMSFEEAQDYISKRGFDIPWNDGDVMVDERKLTQTVANVLKWADRHPLMLPYKKK